MKNKGFTLVEVISVIIILSGIILIAIPSYNMASYAIRKSSYENKINVINSAMLKFAKLHLIDDIKPAGQTCTNQLNCCKEYDLYQFLLTYGVYPAEETVNGESIVIDPLTNEKLNGCVRLTYDVSSLSLKAEFVKDRIINAASDTCKG
jgi:prepilin-type N-terminal cleavage/methylation domain-containing protein